MTVDNAANMLDTVRVLSEDDTDNNNEYNTDNIIQSELVEVLLDEDEEGTLIHSAENSDLDFTITAIRCAAHTLQLAIYDFLKQEKISTITEKARKIVKKLRTPLLQSTLSVLSKKNAILDCTTRWNSTLDVLERLHELKEYCNEINDEDLKLPPIMWNKFFYLIVVLKPARVATKKLQTEQLLVGDLSEIW